MEPWDGPAAIVATDSRWVVAGLDRSGLRPMRYSRTRDGLLVVGSETGMVPLVDNDVIEKGGSARARTSRSTSSTGHFYRDQELKDHLAALKPYSRWMENITHLDERTKARPSSPAAYERAELRRRQALYGLTIEDMELILSPMVLDAKEAHGLDGRRHALGRALPALSRPAPLLPPAVQPGHQPADRPVARMAGDEPEDPLRQSRQRLRRGPEPDPILQLESPVLTNSELEAAKTTLARTIVPSTAPSTPARAACASRWSASARRPRRPCAAAARR